MKILLRLMIIGIMILIPQYQVQADKGTPLKEVRTASDVIVEGYHAIIIGIDDYLSDDIPDLYCENEATNIAEALINHGWVRNKIEILTGKKACYENIMDSISNLSHMKSIPDKSAIMIFYFGHCVCYRNQVFIIPFDGSVNMDKEYFEHRNIRLKTIEDALNQTGFNFKLIVVDEGISEPRKGLQFLNPDEVRTDQLSKGINYIFSADKDEYYFSDTVDFSSFLEKSLSGEADLDKDGLVQFGELESYLPRNRTLKMSVIKEEDNPLVPITVVSKEVSKYELLTLSGHSGSVNSITFSPDGAILASGSDDHKINLWSVATGKCLRTISGYSGNSVAFSPNGSTLAAGSHRAINYWSVDTGKCIRTISVDFGDSVAFSPDGATLASGRDGNGQFSLWSVSSGECIRTICSGNSPEARAPGNATLAFSPDGATIASGAINFSLALWSVSSGEYVRSFGHSSLAIAFSPDGATLASVMGAETIDLWSVSSGECIRKLPGNYNYVFSVAFSPDGKLLASGGSDKTIKLWSVSSGECILKLIGHSDSVTSIAFSPDGTILASGSTDKTIKLWRVK